MKWMRDRVLAGELVSGTFLSLGSSLTAEIAGNAGYDYVILDLEHGSGDLSNLLVQLQAVAATPAAPIVRVTWNEAPRYKRALDMGASGVMTPWVNSEAEARAAVRAMLYPPDGIRGVAGWNRACQFGPGFKEYFSQANDQLLCVLQIETPEGLDNVEAIAAIDRVDVVYVGPADLSTALGIQGQFDHPRMLEAYDRVLAACRAARKAPGILVQNLDQLEFVVKKGFTFVTIASDAAVVVNGLYSNAALFDRFRTT